MWWMALALAGPVEVPFEAPATVPLFTSLGSVEAKGSAAGDACGEAVAAALEALQAKAARDGRPVLIEAKPGPDGCKQSKKGDTVLTSSIALVGVAVAPGEGLPEVSVERAKAVADAIARQTGKKGEAELVAIKGQAWIDLGELEVEDLAGGPGARAARGFEGGLLPRLAEWGPMLDLVPEVSGVTLIALGEGKGSKREAFRYRVGSADAGAWRLGQFPDEVLLERAQVDRAEPAKVWAFAALDLDLSEAAEGELELRSVDVDDADLEGLEDGEEADI